MLSDKAIEKEKMEVVKRREKAVSAGLAYGATEFIVFQYGINLYGWALYNSPLYKHVCALEANPMFDCYTNIRNIERIGATVTREVVTFQTGQIYYGRSVGDSECIIRVSVVLRTEKTITTGAGKRLGVKVRDGVEFVMPWGRYSMAPMVCADRQDTGEVIRPDAMREAKEKQVASWFAANL